MAGQINEENDLAGHFVHGKEKEKCLCQNINVLTVSYNRFASEPKYYSFHEENI